MCIEDRGMVYSFDLKRFTLDRCYDNVEEGRLIKR